MGIIGGRLRFNMLWGGKEKIRGLKKCESTLKSIKIKRWATVLLLFVNIRT